MTHSCCPRLLSLPSTLYNVCYAQDSQQNVWKHLSSQKSSTEGTEDHDHNSPGWYFSDHVSWLPGQQEPLGVDGGSLANVIFLETWTRPRHSTHWTLNKTVSQEFGLCYPTFLTASHVLFLPGGWGLLSSLCSSGLHGSSLACHLATPVHPSFGFHLNTCPLRGLPWPADKVGVPEGTFIEPGGAFSPLYEAQPKLRRYLVWLFS